MNTDIYAARGCVCPITITPKFSDGTVYTLENNDKIRLTVTCGKKAVIVAESDEQDENGAVAFTIPASDTADLAPTCYGYNAVLLADGTTPLELIPPSSFRLFESYHDYTKEDEDE